MDREQIYLQFKSVIMRVKVVLINICKTIAAIQKGPKILPMDNWDIAG